MSVMVLDAGNSIIKAKIARREKGRNRFSPCLASIDRKRVSENCLQGKRAWEYQRLSPCKRDSLFVGESAERQELITQRTGTARYKRDYYGVLVTAALGQLYDPSREVPVFGSRPPGDVQFRQDLMKSIICEWEGEKVLSIPIELNRMDHKG